MSKSVTTKDGVTVPHKPILRIYRTEGNRALFIRIADEDKDDDALVSLYRLLEALNIDTEKAMEVWPKLRAMKVPAWAERKLKEYYRLQELSERAWIAGE